MELTEEVIDVILSQCPMLQVLILPWFNANYKMILSNEYMYRLLTQRKLKLFCDSTIDYACDIIRQLKKYEIHHVPLEQRVFGDVNTQDICTFKSHADFRQKCVHIDKDIFGVKSHNDY